MTRQANAVDFWRGFALISIFINHIPGIYYTRFTHANYSMSDSADLFVFLAGWALRYVVGTPGRQHPLWYLVLRLGGRALTLYAAQILITMIAIATFPNLSNNSISFLIAKMFQRVTRSAASRSNVVSDSIGSPRSHRLNWCSMSPAAMLAQ